MSSGRQTEQQTPNKTPNTLTDTKQEPENKSNTKYNLEHVAIAQNLCKALSPDYKAMEENRIQEKLLPSIVFKGFVYLNVFTKKDFKLANLLNATPEQFIKVLLDEEHNTPEGDLKTFLKVLIEIIKDNDIESIKESIKKLVYPKTYQGTLEKLYADLFVQLSLYDANKKFNEDLKSEQIKSSDAINEKNVMIAKLQANLDSLKDEDQSKISNITAQLDNENQTNKQLVREKYIAESEITRLKKELNELIIQFQKTQMEHKQSDDKRIAELRNIEAQAITYNQAYKASEYKNAELVKQLQLMHNDIVKEKKLNESLFSEKTNLINENKQLKSDIQSSEKNLQAERIAKGRAIDNASTLKKENTQLSQRCNELVLQIEEEKSTDMNNSPKNNITFFSSNKAAPKSADTEQFDTKNRRRRRT